MGMGERGSQWQGLLYMVWLESFDFFRNLRGATGFARVWSLSAGGGRPPRGLGPQPRAKTVRSRSGLWGELYGTGFGRRALRVNLVLST